MNKVLAVLGIIVLLVVIVPLTVTGAGPAGPKDIPDISDLGDVGEITDYSTGGPFSPHIFTSKGYRIMWGAQGKRIVIGPPPGPEGRPETPQPPSLTDPANPNYDPELAKRLLDSPKWPSKGRGGAAPPPAPGEAHKVWGSGINKFDNTSDNDGYAYKYAWSYTEARNATAASVINTNQTWSMVGQRYDGETWYTVDRAFVYFSTGAIPDGATIDEATLSLWGLGDASSQDFNIQIQNGQPTYPHIPLEIGDYNQAFYSGNGGSLNTSSFKVNDWNLISFSSEGKGWINRTGVTKLVLRSDRDVAGVTPQGDEYVWFATTEYGSNIPRLRVAWTADGQPGEAVFSANWVYRASVSQMVNKQLTLPIDGDLFYSPTFLLPNRERLEAVTYYKNDQGAMKYQFALYQHPTSGGGSPGAFLYFEDMDDAWMNRYTEEGLDHNRYYYVTITYYKPSDDFLSKVYLYDFTISDWRWFQNYTAYGQSIIVDGWNFAESYFHASQQWPALAMTAAWELWVDLSSDPNKANWQKNNVAYGYEYDADYLGGGLEIIYDDHGFIDWRGTPTPYDTWYIRGTPTP